MKSYIVFLSLFFNSLSYSQSLDSSQIDRINDEKLDTLFPKMRLDVNLLEDYITTIFIYPENEIESIIGTVWISFYVDLNGVTKDVIILKGLSKLINKEAIRVFKVLPNLTFIPLEKDGEYINQRFIYPVKVNGRGSDNYNTKKIYNPNDLDLVPSYIGGVSELALFIQQNFTIPLVSIEMGEQCCNIWFEFVVEIDGSVSNVKILKSESLSQGKEGIRVIKLLDKWNPGMINGVPVRSFYSIPIKS